MGYLDVTVSHIFDPCPTYCVVRLLLYFVDCLNYTTVISILICSRSNNMSRKTRSLDKKSLAIRIITMDAELEFTVPVSFLFFPLIFSITQFLILLHFYSEPLQGKSFSSWFAVRLDCEKHGILDCNITTAKDFYHG